MLHLVLPITLKFSPGQLSSAAAQHFGFLLFWHFPVLKDPVWFIKQWLKRWVPRGQESRWWASNLDPHKCRLNIQSTGTHAHSQALYTLSHTHTNTHLLSVPAGQQTSSFPPPCTQFPPAGWPTWPVHTAGSLGWHHTANGFVTDVNTHPNKCWINTD